MAKYKIGNESFLGMSDCGAVTVDSEGFVELSDVEVATLIDLIVEKQTLDIEELQLEELHPQLFEKLDDAYRTIAFDAEEVHWLKYGYDNQLFEYDEDELIEYCKENCGFEFEYDEEDYTDDDGELDEEAIHDEEQWAFGNWLDKYVESLSDDDFCEFVYEHMNADCDLCSIDIDYTVCIPEDIVKMAKAKLEQTK